eukprot:361066-Chlamydomonas_euryale.AAC.1
MRAPCMRAIGRQGVDRVYACCTMVENALDYPLPPSTAHQGEELCTGLSPWMFPAPGDTPIEQPLLPVNQICRAWHLAVTESESKLLHVVVTEGMTGSHIEGLPQQTGIQSSDCTWIPTPFRTAAQRCLTANIATGYGKAIVWTASLHQLPLRHGLIAAGLRPQAQQPHTPCPATRCVMP